MLIASFCVENYKSFLETPEIKLTSGFNVIVGQNNVGKTALVEALSMRAGAQPHRSLRTAPTRDTPLDRPSTVAIKLELSGSELPPLLRRLSNFYFPTHESEASKAVKQATALLGNASLSLVTTWVNGGVSAAAFADSPVPAPLFAILRVGSSGAIEAAQPNNVSVDDANRFERRLAELVRNDRVYLFNAERLRVGLSPFGTGTVLQPNAANLPEVLANLRGRNPRRFERLVGHVRAIFPAIQDIAIHSRDGNSVEILVWTVDPGTERDDLAIRLVDSGTGIGQVLAMLYVVVAAEAPQVILIDEPQSFLHPGALRKLIEILQQQSHRHQYILTTHSPTAITASDPSTLLRLSMQNGETRVDKLDTSLAHDQRLMLADIGARLADVFGADAILWVEGATEEFCFPRIVHRLTTLQLLGTSIVGVLHTADFEARRSEATVEMYQRLSVGRGLLPPAVGFVFDREGRGDRDREDLERYGNVFFLLRRMYENYLLLPDAIAAVMSGIEGFRDPPVSPGEVQRWLDAHAWDEKYFDAVPTTRTPSEWFVNVHGAKLLGDVFVQLSETRVRYDKVRHGVALTEWLLEHAPEELREVAQVVEQALAGHNGKARPPE